MSCSTDRLGGLIRFYPIAADSDTIFGYDSWNNHKISYHVVWRNPLKHILLWIRLVCRTPTIKLPYPRHAYGFTHPDRLATLATLHGLEPPPIERARILEVGCAAAAISFRWPTPCRRPN